MRPIGNRVLAIVLFLFASLGLANRYAQVVIPIPTKTRILTKENKQKNYFDLYLQATTGTDIEGLENYDERLIRRVLLKQHGVEGTTIRFYLKDKKVRATINRYDSPSRVVIELFESGYTPAKDPKTGLPLPSLFAQNSPTMAVLDESPIPAESLGLTPMDVPSDQYEDDSGSLQLLAPSAVDDDTIELNSLDLADIPTGRGKAWVNYPFYIYPLQTAAYLGRKSPAGYDPSDLAAAGMSKGQAMAELALKQFTFGHESRALELYRRTLQMEPQIFDRDAVHLWALAESNLGQGNLSLARGYYTSLNQKHPSSPLSALSKMRAADLIAIKLDSEEVNQDYSPLKASIQTVNTQNSPEIAALVSLRKIFWSNPKTNAIPPINSSTYQDLARLWSGIENTRTAYLVASIMLRHKLNETYSTLTADFADTYFSKFEGVRPTGYYESLKSAFETSLTNFLISASTENKHIEATKAFEGLPNRFTSLVNQNNVSWAVAESHRNLGKNQIAIEYYGKVADTGEASERNFKANFWKGYLSTQSEPSDTELQANADSQMAAIWTKLSEQEKASILTQYSDALKQAAVSDNKLQSPPRIILAALDRSLGGRLASESDTGDTWKSNYSPSKATFEILLNLISKFEALGMNANRRKAQTLLAKLDPGQLEADKEAEEQWLESMLQLAEEYRTSQSYLESGRIYALTAEKSKNWVRRAEALYKGGLLLFRSGKREEAIKALTAASQDGNNMFYANLAKERLNQLQEQ